MARDRGYCASNSSEWKQSLKDCLLIGTCNRKVLMWGIFGRTHAKEKVLEDRFEGYITRLHKFITACIETGFSGTPLSPQLINSPEISEPLSQVLAAVLTEDSLLQSRDDFAPALLWILSRDFFDQLTAWAQLNQPPGLFAKILHFLTVLVMDVRNQPLMQHVSFNRALLSILDITNERMKRGQLFTEAEETVIPLVRAICERVLADASLAAFVMRRSDTSQECVLVPVLQYFLENEKREEHVLECVQMIAQFEDSEVAAYLAQDSQVIQLVARRLIKYLTNLPKISPRPQAQKSSEVDDVCRYFRSLDSLCSSCLHHCLTALLTSTLLSECLQPYIGCYLYHTEVEVRTLFTRYLLQMLGELRSPEMLICVAQLIRGSGPQSPTKQTHDRFESISTMVSGSRTLPDPPKSVPKENTWDAFLDNLRSSSFPLRMASLRVLYFLLTRGEWRLVQILVTDHFFGESPVGFSSCSYERFLSNFPASLLYGGIRHNSLYYFESVRAMMRCRLPSLDHVTCPSFTILRDSTAGLDRASSASEGELMVIRPKDLYGSWKDESALPDEGPVMKLLLEKTEGLLKNKLEENLLITGILTALCRLPALNIVSPTLSYLLFTTSDSPTLLSVLKGVRTTQIDLKILAFSSAASNFESALYGARKALGLEVDSSLHADKNYFELLLKQTDKRSNGPNKKVRDAHFIEVLATQGVVVYQEFVRELAGCVLAQEQLAMIRDCAHEAAL